MNANKLLILVLILLLSSMPLSAAAQESDLEGSLVELGLVDPQLTIGENQAVVTYKQSVAEMGEFDAELGKIARIFVLFSDRLSPQAEITVRQLFDDGQIMQLVGTPALGKAFLDGETTADDFQMALRFEPQTRGPIIVEGVCDPPAGDSCQNKEACACYPNEECRPDDPAASPKGCVVINEPGNAHLEGAEYACNEGYGWNTDMTNCEPEMVCPEGMVEAINRECVPAAAPVEELELETYPDHIETPPTGLQIPIWIWFIIGGGCFLIVGLIILGFVVLRRRRKPTAQPAPVYQPAAQPSPQVQVSRPAPPALPEPFASLERRYASLQSSYRSGAMSQATYQTEMKELVIKDREGRYWTRTNTGWMWYDGQRWVPGRPPQQ